MDNDSSRRDNQDNILHGHGQSSKPGVMPLQHLKEITNNFSDERILGEGGFGVVYKGVLENGEMVAVKKLLQPMPNFLKQFKNEVDLLMRLKHPNIVGLIGYCYETQNIHMDHNGEYIFAGMTQSLLCLEYLPKGSLDKYISDESCGLDWRTRYKIIEGICNGLRYLHEQNKPIIHLDLKPANVLLNGNMVPKVTDFGLSRLLDQQQTVCTLFTTGTRGYMPPEYIQGGTITPMSDIFSLGVIILEVVTGHRNYPDVTKTSSEDFIELTLQKWRNVLEKASGHTSLEIDCQQIKRCIQIGLICVNPERTKRPTAAKIIKMLQGLESLDCHGGNVVTSSASQSTSSQKELLDIYPLELCFSLEPDKRIPCLVKLTNKTDGYVAFHFKATRATNKYCIEPASGFLWPLSPFNVVVTMEERCELPSDLQCNDEFLVQSIAVRKDRIISEHITEDTFKKVSSKAVHKVNLTVVYVPPAQPTSDAQQFEGSRGQSHGRPEISTNQRLQQENQEQFSTQPRSLIEGAQENQDALIECVAKNLGYCAGKPTAAITIYKCLIQWRSFEAERTSVFDRLVQLIASAVEVEDNNDMLAYWLSNSSTLLVLMQRTLKTTGEAGFTPQGQRSSSTSLFDRISAGFRASLQSTGGKGNLQQVEAKYPALLFKQHLTAFLEKIYGTIRDNLKKEVAPLLGLCIQAPRTLRARMIKGSRSQPNDLAQQTLINHWQSIVKLLTNYMSVLKSNYVPSFLISEVFTQVCSFINVQLFNSLLLRRECCSFSNAEYVKSGLAELEQWCIYGTEEYAGSSWEELKHIRQAVGFLLLYQKPKMTIEEITEDLCPVLSIQQLYRISTLYWDDKNGTQSVSSEVVASMRIMMTEDSNNAVSSSFLLDDNSSIPFSVDDIWKSLAELEVTDVDVPPSLRENPSFNFLQERKN